MPKRKRPAARHEPDAGVILRAAVPADLDRVARIWLEGWQSLGITLAEAPDYSALRARIAAEIAGGWAVTVAELGGVVAGFVAIRAEAGVLEQIFIAPEFHRRGCGAALLGHARAAMPSGFALWTHIDNHGAARFYTAQGMACTGEGVHPRAGHRILHFAMAAA